MAAAAASIDRDSHLISVSKGGETTDRGWVLQTKKYGWMARKQGEGEKKQKKHWAASLK